MPFRFDPRKPFPEELQRIGIELIDDAMAALSQQPDGPHAAVHGARKKFKRLRALYRFVKSDDPAFRTTENLRFRDVARSLSQAREAAALVETIQYLQGFSRSEAESKALSSALGTLEKRRDEVTGDDGGLSDNIALALVECDKARQALMQLSLPDGRKAATRRVKKTWRKQRQTALDALSRCHGEAHDEDFHDLRKSGQVYWMHLALLRRIWPSAMRAKKADAKRLVDLLGHEHDLSVLTALVDQEPERFDDADTLALVLEAIIHRQQALRQECLDLADRVFSDAAKTESRIVAHLWDDAAR